MRHQGIPYFPALNTLGGIRKILRSSPHEELKRRKKRDPGSKIEMNEKGRNYFASTLNFAVVVFPASVTFTAMTHGPSMMKCMVAL